MAKEYKNYLSRDVHGGAARVVGEILGVVHLRNNVFFGSETVIKHPKHPY